MTENRKGHPPAEGVPSDHADGAVVSGPDSILPADLSQLSPEQLAGLKTTLQEQAATTGAEGMKSQLQAGIERLDSILATPPSQPEGAVVEEIKTVEPPVVLAQEIKPTPEVAQADANPVPVEPITASVPTPPVIPDLKPPTPMDPEVIARLSGEAPVKTEPVVETMTPAGSPATDPDVISVERWINDHTEGTMIAADQGLMGDATKQLVKGSEGQAFRNQTESKAALQAWVTFVRNNPEKAAAYRGQHSGIDRAMRVLESAGRPVKPGENVTATVESKPTPEPENFAGEALLYQQGTKPLSEILSPDEEGVIKEQRGHLTTLVQQIREAMPLEVSCRKDETTTEGGWHFRGIEDGRVVIDKKAGDQYQTERLTVDDFLAANALSDEIRTQLLQASSSDRTIGQTIEHAIRAKRGPAVAQVETSPAVEPRVLDVEATPVPGGRFEAPVVIPADPTTADTLRARLVSAGRGEASRGASLRERLRTAGMVEVEPAGPPAFPGTPEAAPEGKGPETRAEEGEAPTLDGLREKYVRLLASQRKLFGAAKDAELAAARNEYLQEVGHQMSEELTAINQEFAGRDLKDPIVIGEYTSRVVAVRETHRMREESSVIDLMRSEHDRSTSAKWMATWRKTAGGRALASGTLLAAGVVGALTGQGWVTKVAAPLRGAMAGAGTGMLVESVLRSARRNLGETRDLSPKAIAEMDDQKEIERLIAAHNIDAIEYRSAPGTKGKTLKERLSRTPEPEAELGVRTHKFLFWKKEDKTGQLLRQRLAEIEKGQLSYNIAEAVKRGWNADEITRKTIDEFVDDEAERSSLAVKRIRANKKASAAISMISLGVGVGTGVGVALTAVESAQHLGEAIKGFLTGHQGPEGAEEAGKAGKAVMKKAKTLAEHNRRLAEMAQQEPGVAMPDNTVVNSPIPEVLRTVKGAGGAVVKTAVEAGGTTTPLTETVETIHKGDSVWTATADFVKHNFSQLNREQQVWMTDAIKDKIVAHPELLGLKDPSLVHAGDTVDFGKLGISYQELAGKAAKLSAKTLGSIKENLDHPVAMADAPHGVEVPVPVNPAEVTGGTPVVEAVSHTATTTPTVEAGANVAQGTETIAATTAAAESVPLAGEVPHDLTGYFDAYGDAWRALPGRSLEVLDKFKTVDVAEASKPGVIEGLLAVARDSTDEQRAAVAKALRAMLLQLGKLNYDQHAKLYDAVEWLRENHHN